MKKLALLLHSKVFIAVALSVVAAVSVAAAVVLSDKSAAEEVYRIIKVFEMNGTASVSRADVGTLTPYVGMNLENGDVLATYADSSMRLSLDSDKFLLMEENTEIELSASGTAEDSMTRIVLKSGAVLNEILKPLSDRSNYEIYTPKATMAVRGTSYLVHVYKDSDGSYITVVDVFNGKVGVTLIGEDGKAKTETVYVPENKRIVIKTDPKEGSNKDAFEDGNSYFVYENTDGKFKPLETDMSPLSKIKYEEVSYEALYEVYSSDLTDDLKLGDIVLEEVIDALFGGDESNGEPKEPAAEDPNEPEDPDDPGKIDEENNNASPYKPGGPSSPGNPGEPGDDGDGAEVPSGEGAPPSEPPAGDEPPADNDGDPIVTTAPEDNENDVTTAPADPDDTDDPGDVTSVPDDNNDGDGDGDVTTVSDEDVTTVSEEETTLSTSESEGDTTTVSESETEAMTTTAPPSSPPSGSGSDSEPTEPPVTNPPAPVSYKVTFSTRGSSIDEQTVSANGTAEKPADPEREGYTFVGWEVDGEPYDFTKPVTGDITINAVWEINTYTVTFDSGDTKTEVTVKYEYSVERPDDPERQGYTFAGWYYNGEIYSFNSPVRSDIVITAKWREATDTPYKVKHYKQNISGDGYDIADTDELTGTTGGKTAAEAKSYPGFRAGTVTQQTIAADGTTEVVILYTRTSLKVTWDLDGGILSGLSTTVKYGEKITDPGEPTKTGHTFKGWTVDGTEYDFDTPVTSDLTIKADWETNIIIVGLIYQTPDDLTPQKKIQRIPYGETLSEPEAPEKTGYEFVEWRKGDAAYDFSTPVTESFDLTTYYRVKTYKAVFKADGEEFDVQTIEHGKTAKEPAAVPTKTGHTFTGWFIGDEEYDFDTAVTGDIEITAGWERIQLQISWDYAPEDAVAVQMVYYGDKLTRPADPTREGYDFVEWQKVKGTEITTYDFDEPVTESFMISAKWREQLTVTIDAGPDYSLMRKKVSYGEKLEKPSTDPTREGYDFVEWQKDGVAYNFNTPVTESFTLKAYYKLKTFTVVFVEEGGDPDEPIDSQEVTYGMAAVEPDWSGYREEGEGDSRVKYKSSGWDKDFSNVTGDMEIHPVYGEEAPKYDVNIRVAPGIMSVKVYEGDEAPILGDYNEGDTQIFTGKLLVFEYWKDEDTGSKITDFTVWGDMNITAVYKSEDVAEVNLAVDGSLKQIDDTYAYDGKYYAEVGKTLELPAYTPKTGYNFGWFKATSGLMNGPENMCIEEDTLVSSFTVSEDVLGNCYQGGSYTTIEFRYYESTETVGSATSKSADRTVLFYNGNYYIGHGGYWFSVVAADRGIYIEGGPEDLRMNDFTYRLKNGTDISFDQLYSGERYADVSFAYKVVDSSTKVTLIYPANDGTMKVESVKADAGDTFSISGRATPYSSKYSVKWYKAKSSMLTSPGTLDLYRETSYNGMYDTYYVVSADSFTVSDDNNENIYVAVNYRSTMLRVPAYGGDLDCPVLYYNGNYYYIGEGQENRFSDDCFILDDSYNDKSFYLDTDEVFTWETIRETNNEEWAFDHVDHVGY